jgi:hypothetical protein
MAILRTDITRALDELIENESGTEFQALAVVLAKQWPELIATERQKDGGVDACVPATLTDGRMLTKINGDAQTAKQNCGDLESLLFVTPHKKGPCGCGRGSRAVASAAAHDCPPTFSQPTPRQKLIGEIWEIEAILAQDVMIMNPARFAPFVAMARV